MNPKPIPNETIGRLFVYFRALMCLRKENKSKTVSSTQLSEICQVKPAVIRKDLSYFGEFGTRGVGYGIEELIQKIKEILKLDPVIKVAVVGVGNIGRALLSYSGFENEGFTIVMAFDSRAEVIGQKFGNITVEDVENLEKRIRSEGIQVGILAVPESAAPVIARRLEKGGVKAVLSFAPCQLFMPDSVQLTCVDLSMEMARLFYYSFSGDV